MSDIFKKHFIDCNSEVNVGIDEAGRGPVLGYLVYGALITETDFEIKKFNFKDSKMLSPEKRRILFDAIENNFSYSYKAIHPSTLTNKMTLGTNLNQICFNTIIDILASITLNYKVKTVFIDTVGCPIKMTQMMQKRFPGIKFNIKCKADSLYPIVSGASIVAKVIRDNLINNTSEASGNSSFRLGSGYPADPTTVAWLKNNFNPVFGFNNFVRLTWKTVKNFFPGRKGVQLKGKLSSFYLS